MVHEDREKNWQQWKSAEAIKQLLFQEAKLKSCTCVFVWVKACVSDGKNTHKAPCTVSAVKGVYSEP